MFLSSGRSETSPSATFTKTKTLDKEQARLNSCLNDAAKQNLNPKRILPKPLDPVFSEASKGGMKVGGMFPNKGPYIRDP